MADHDDNERFHYLAETVIAAYTVIKRVLADLPLPVGIVDFDPANPPGEQGETLLSLNRARTIVHDEPIHELKMRTIENLILDWFTAYELIALSKIAGPVSWRLDSVEYALLRVQTWLETLEEDDWDKDDESES